jgi:hypothetical protein
MIACPVIPRREIPFSPLSDNWMCQTYCVWTWTKYSVERNPKKYFVKSMRIHTNTNTIYQWRWKSWSLRQLVSHYFLDSLVSPCLHFLDKLEDHFDKAGCTLRLSDVGPLRLLYHPLGEVFKWLFIHHRRTIQRWSYLIVSSAWVTFRFPTASLGLKSISIPS